MAKKIQKNCRIGARKSARERLHEFWDVFDKEDIVLVCINADPDAIACALAIKRLLRFRVKQVIIAHPNEIRRLNNVSMVERLKIPLERLGNVKVQEFTKKPQKKYSPWNDSFCYSSNYFIYLYTSYYNWHFTS